MMYAYMVETREISTMLKQSQVLKKISSDPNINCWIKHEYNLKKKSIFYSVNNVLKDWYFWISAKNNYYKFSDRSDIKLHIFKEFIKIILSKSSTKQVILKL